MFRNLDMQSNSNHIFVAIEMEQNGRPNNEIVHENNLRTIWALLMISTYRAELVEWLFLIWCR